MDVLLVNLPYPLCAVTTTSKIAEQMGLGYLAAMLRKSGYKVELFDAFLYDLTVQQTVEEIKKRDSDILGFAVYQEQIDDLITIINSLRSDGTDSHITLGGQFPTLAYRELLQAFNGIDSITIGEGEYTLLELTEKIINDSNWKEVSGISYREGNKIVTNPPRPLIMDLDSLPFPERDTLLQVLEKGGIAQIVSSRGCYANCSFCSIPSFHRAIPGPKWRGRGPEKIVDEIESLTEKFKIDLINFNDANFFGPGKIGKKRVRQIGEEILRRRLDIEFYIGCRPDDVDAELFTFLKRVGLKGVLLGIESGVQRALDTFNKGITVEENKQAIAIINKLEINLDIGFIMYDPYVTLNEIKQNIEFLKKTNLYLKDLVWMWLGTSWLKPFYGTQIHQKLIKEKRLRESFDFEYDFEDPKVKVLFNIMCQLQELMFPIRQEILKLRMEVWKRLSELTSVGKKIILQKKVSNLLSELTLSKKEIIKYTNWLNRQLEILSVNFFERVLGYLENNDKEIEQKVNFLLDYAREEIKQMNKEIKYLKIIMQKGEDIKRDALYKLEEHMPKYVAKSEKTSWRIIDGNVYVLVPESGSIQVLNSVGTRIWKLVNGKMTVEEIVLKICEEFDVEREKGEKDVLKFIRELVNSKMVEFCGTNFKSVRG
jgi:radical SAM superfamily enzyme YgiQ (UPF0313 family)